jgi:hypothetical protein
MDGVDVERELRSALAWALPLVSKSSTPCYLDMYCHCGKKAEEDQHKPHCELRRARALLHGDSNVF